MDTRPLHESYVKVLDQEELTHYNYPGSSETRYDFELKVSGSITESARAWYIQQAIEDAADGTLIDRQTHSTEGPLEDGSFIYRITATIHREW